MADGRQDVLVVCLVESSVALLQEWLDILQTYVASLLYRIAPDKSTWTERLPIGFIYYSDSYVHPNPILVKRFFTSLRQITAEVLEYPAGIGRAASSGHRGMAVLEGYAAALEMFDTATEVRITRSQSMNEARPDVPLKDHCFYVIHVASSPPNDAIKPSWNTDPALDEVSWDSLPSELLKRKISLNMILTRPIPKLLDLHKHISRIPDPSWLTLLKPSHRLLFSGLPPKETKLVPQKRAATENAEDPHQPRPSPQEQAANPAPPTAAVPVTPAVSNVVLGPSNQPQPESQALLQQPQSQSQPSQPQPSQLQPQPQPQQPQSQPQPQPLPQSQPPPHTQHVQSSQPRIPAALGQNIDFAKLGQYIRALQNECRLRMAAISQASAAGKPKVEIDAMQADLNQKLETRTKMWRFYQHMVQQANGGGPSNQGANASNTQPAGNTPSQQTRPTQEQSDASMTPSKPVPSGQATPLTNNTGPTPNLASRNFLQTMPISSRPGMEAQMQKLLAERTRHAALAAAPQTQHQSPAPVPNLMQPTQADQGMATNQAANPTIPAASNIDITMTPRATYGAFVRRWQGVLSWPGVRKENLLFIALFSTSNDLRCESWPRKLTFQPLRIPWTMPQIQRWKNELNPATVMLTATPIPGDVASTTQNNILFNQLKDLIIQRNMLACCKLDIPGGPPGAGFITFPVNNNQPDALVALVFHMSAMPAALFVPPPPSQVSSNLVPSTEGTSTSLSQAMNIGAGLNPLQNLSSETKAYLEQRKAAALSAYNQQQLAQQQAQHHKGLITNPVTSTGQNTGGTFNVPQFLQGMQGMQQQADAGIQMGLGGSNLTQTPALQQVQHRQPSGFNPGQGGGLQMLQYHMNRRPEDGQGQ